MHGYSVLVRLRSGVGGVVTWNGDANLVGVVTRVQLLLS